MRQKGNNLGVVSLSSKSETDLVLESDDCGYDFNENECVMKIIMKLNVRTAG